MSVLRLLLLALVLGSAIAPAFSPSLALAECCNDDKKGK